MMAEPTPLVTGFDELERLHIADRIYHSHPDRARLAELLGLNRRERAILDPPANPDPWTVEPACGHMWGLHTVADNGCTATTGCLCLVMPGGRR